MPLECLKSPHSISPVAEALFKSRVKRVMGVGGHEQFLKLTDGVSIDVVAIKFSDRIDIMEGIVRQ